MEIINSILCWQGWKGISGILSLGILVSLIWHAEHVVKFSKWGKKKVKDLHHDDKDVEQED